MQINTLEFSYYMILKNYDTQKKKKIANMYCKNKNICSHFSILIGVAPSELVKQFAW